MNNFNVEKNELEINDFIIEFDYEISDVKFMDGIYVVLLDIPVGVDEIDNIYGVAPDGVVVWRVENPIKAFELDESTQGFEYYAKSIYVDISFDDKKSLSGTTFFGMKYIIDCKTGKLLEKYYIRW